MHGFGIQVADARRFSDKGMIRLSALDRTDGAASDQAEFGQHQTLSFAVQSAMKRRFRIEPLHRASPQSSFGRYVSLGDQP